MNVTVKTSQIWQNDKEALFKSSVDPRNLIENMEYGILTNFILIRYISRVK